MKKLLILALASAFSVVAIAATGSWFEGRANGTADNASWSSPQDGVTFTGSVINLDLDSGEALELTPTGSAPDTATKTFVTIRGAQFTPCARDSIDDSLPGDVQTALTVAYDGGNTNYYAYTGSGWETLSATPTSSPVDVVIEMYYYTNTTGVTARFLIGDQDAGTIGLVTNNVGTVNSVSLAGNGKVASLATEVELGYASYGDRKYPSVADAIAARGNNVGNDITLHEHGGSYGADNVITMPSNDDTTTVLAFPRTATAGQTGAEDHPYEISDLDDLVAFQKAVHNCLAARTNCYAQTANIELNAPWPGIGIQNGKDIVSSNEYEDGAFRGTFDGGNHTISGFQMVGGNLDYCGLFNSTYRAVVKNLKIQYKETKYAADTSKSTVESGATFVGVAKQTKLENLTSLPAQGETSVCCGKGIGGIVGYLNDGSSVDSCTNTVALTSYSNKAGGIAMIRQNGDSCTINNCKNTGMMSSEAGDEDKKLQFGAIVGYVDDGIVISNCENTASCKMFHNNSGEFTVGGVNKGPASVVAYSGGAVDGFTFATVSDDVATFVKKNDLAAGNAYLLTGDVGSGKVFTFAEKGNSIEFDTALGCEFAGTVDAAQGLVVDRSENGEVIAYTAYQVSELSGTVATGVGVNDTDSLKSALTEWVANGVVSAAELTTDAAAAMTDTRTTGNKLTLLQSYVLNLNPSDAGSTVKAELPEGVKTEGSGADTKILVKVPTPRSDTGYTVKYQIKSWNGSAWDDYCDPVDYDKIKIPVGTGRYRVDAVLQK